MNGSALDPRLQAPASSGHEQQLDEAEKGTSARLAEPVRRIDRFDIGRPQQDVDESMEDFSSRHRKTAANVVPMGLFGFGLTTALVQASVRHFCVLGQ